jgi:hypothetical protein
MANLSKTAQFLAARVAAGKLTQPEADAILAKKAAKVPAGLVGVVVTDMTNAQQAKLLQVIAVRLGLSDSTGKVL